MLSRTANVILLALLATWGTLANLNAQSAFTWIGTNGSWTDSGNWTVSGNGSGFPDATDDSVYFTQNTTTIDISMPSDSSAVAGTITMNGTGTVRLGNATTFAGNLTLGSASVPILNVNSGRLAIFTELTGSQGFRKIGSGILNFNTNTLNMSNLTGNVSIEDGTVWFQHAGNFGGGNLSFSGSNTLFQLRGNSTTTFSENRNISIATGSNINFWNFDTLSGMVFDGPITGSGNLIFTNGNFTLNGVNTHSGNTTMVGSGADKTVNILLGNGSNLSNGTLNFTSQGTATINLGGNAQIIQNLVTESSNAGSSMTISNGSLFISGGGDVSLGGRGGSFTLSMANLTSFSAGSASSNFTFQSGNTTGTTTNILTLSTNGTNAITGKTVLFGRTSTGGASTGTAYSANVNLGSVNAINADIFKVGSTNSTSSLAFQAGLSNPSLTLRSANGTGAVSEWIIGELTAETGGRSGLGTVDLQGGTLDALVGNLTVALNNNSTVSSTSWLKFSAGNLTADTIRLANKSGSSTGALSGAIYQSGGNASVDLLEFGSSGSGNSTITAFYELAGGRLEVGDIQVGGGNFTNTSNRTLLISGNATLANISGANLTVTGASNSSSGLMKININGAATLLASSGDIIFSSNSSLTGSGSLTKSGSGNLVLSGISSFTGAMNINDGAVVLGGNQSLGAIAGSGNLTLGSNTLTTNSSSSTTFSGVISGSGGLAKNGTGTLTLDGENSYNGSTTINAGTLAVTGNISSSAVTLNSGGVISAGSANAVDKFSTSSLTINGGSGYALTIGNISGGTSGTAGVDYDQIEVSGALTFNNTLENPFIVYLRGTPSNWTSSGSYTWNIMAGTSISGFSPGNFVADTSNFGGNLSGAASWTFGTSGSNLTLTYGASSAPTWSGGSGNWSGNFSPGVSNNINLLFAGNGGTATNDIPAATLSTIGSITFNSTSGAYILAANSGSAGNGSALGVSISIVNNSLNTQTINAAVNFSATRSIDAAAGGILIGGVISGVGGFAKNGNYSLTLAGNNSFTGDMAINTGTVEIGSPGRLGAGNYTGSISNSGELIYSGTNNQTLSGVISGAGALTHNATSRLTLSANNTFTGNTTITAGTIEIGAPGRLGQGDYLGSISSNGLLIYSGTSNQTLSGIISGTGALTHNATSRLTLSANNTYTGNTTINTGTVEIGASGRLGGGSYSGNIAISGTLIYSGTNNQALSGIISGTGALTHNASSRLTLSANNTYTGNTTINTGTVEIGASGRLGGGNYTGKIINSGVLIYSGTANHTLSGIISGTGVLTHNASSRLTLSANNTYTGNTTINTGTIEIGASGRLGGGNYTGRIINSGELIYSGTNNQTLSGIISGTGALTHNASSRLTLSANNSYTGDTTINTGIFEITTTGLLGGGNYSGNITNSGSLVFGSNSNQTLSGTISGSGNITKNGNGTLTLLGNTNYSGNTTIHLGTVVIGNANAAGSGKIFQIDSTSLLKFNTAGTITNDMSVFNVQTLQTADLSGAITVNNATWDVETGATLTINGSVSGSGGVTKNGNGTLVLSGSNSYAAATTINAGTLQAAHANSLGSNNTVQIHGGTLLVSADDALAAKQIEMSTNSIGLRFSGNYIGSVGRLTLSANSIIDLGQGSTKLSFHEVFMDIYYLNFYNWTGTTRSEGGIGDDTDEIYLGTAGGGNYDLSKVRFYSGTTSDSFLGNGFDLGFDVGFSGNQIIPVPEPETWAVACLLLLGGYLWMWRGGRLQKVISPERIECIRNPHKESDQKKRRPPEVFGAGAIIGIRNRALNCYILLSFSSLILQLT